MKKILLAILALALIFALCACGAKGPKSISIDSNGILLGTGGETFDIKTVLTIDGDANSKFSYSSSDTSVAEISAEGIIIAKGEGSTVVTVSSDANSSIKASVDVLVYPYYGAYAAEKYIEAMGCDIKVRIALNNDGSFDYYRYPMTVALDGGGEMPGLEDKGIYEISGNQINFNAEYLGEYSLEFSLNGGLAALSGSVPTGGAKTQMELVLGYDD